MRRPRLFQPDVTASGSTSRVSDTLPNPLDNMTKNTAPKAPAKPRAKAPAADPVVATDAPAEAAPRLVLSLHHRIDWNDDGRA